MGKCHICGKKALEVVEVCPECLQRAAVDPKQIKRLKQISGILRITAGTDTNIKECMESIKEIAEELERGGTNGKKKRSHKIKPFKQDNRVVYNTAKPNRQARRLGAVAVEPPKKEEPKRVSKAGVLRKSLQQAQEIQKKIVPPDMTYGEYMEYLKEKRQQLEDKKK